MKQKTPQFAGLFFPKITQRASRISGDPVRVLFHHLFDETERVSLGLEPKPDTHLDHDLSRFVSHITMHSGSGC